LSNLTCCFRIIPAFHQISLDNFTINLFQERSSLLPEKYSYYLYDLAYYLHTLIKGDNLVVDGLDCLRVWFHPSNLKQKTGGVVKVAI